jgi:hypothetical protein
MRLMESLADPDGSEPIRNVRWLEGAIAAAWVNTTWGEAAQWLSRSHGGVFIPTDVGLVWRCGNRTERLMIPEYYDLVVEARAVCVQLGCPPGDSIGQCARNILKWIGRRQYPEKGLWNTFHDQMFGYHDCSPGTYELGVQYDVSAYYYTLWCKLPCLRCSLGHDGRIIWHQEGSEEGQRREKVAELVKSCKVLRNSLVGCALGSSTPMNGFHKGQRISMKPSLGPFRPSSIVTIRTAYELCQIASEYCSSVYTMTDSVLSIGGEYPETWEKYGFRVRIVGQGEADICTTAVYRIGNDPTHFYDRGSRYRRAVPREPLGDVRLYDKWLKAA